MTTTNEPPDTSDGLDLASKHKKPSKKDKKPMDREEGPNKLANVIQVSFGPGGGRVDRVDPRSIRLGEDAALKPKHVNPAQGDHPGAANTRREPVTDLFSKKEVAKLLGLTEARLRTLDKAEIVSPTGMGQNGRRAYTFQDLIALRATLLLAKDVKLRDVAKAIGALRQSLPRVTRPLQELRIVSDGRRVVVRSHDGTFEPVTGQLHLDFQVTALRDDVVRVLRPESAAGRARTAYDLYARASTLDEDPDTFEEAEKLYLRALELDPHLAIAYTNLGNIRFRRGDDKGAEELYVRALDVDERQPEAHYNLGYVMLERGDARRAVLHFERAIARDPRFADAHFNLAMALEQLAERTRARAHWKRYLELEPAGTWAEIARQHL
jgi:tetratricopeptide (TPR) repeat protein